MIRMTSSQMLQMTTEEMDANGLIITTPASSASLNISITPDMLFNEGHKLSIIVYRFEKYLQNMKTHKLNKKIQIFAVF